VGERRGLERIEGKIEKRGEGKREEEEMAREEMAREGSR